MSTFEIGETDFLLDGAPYRVLSGAIHYFRVHPEHWRDRIRKARLMGLNTIETYVPWNAHEPAQGEFRAEGGLDLGAFLEAVDAEGMRAIVRPGPYICAEWDNGGLPAWLFTDDEVGIRRFEPRYLAAVEAYLGFLAPIITSRQIDRGGPVILIQIENEYGAFGADPAYLRHLVALHRRLGFTVPFTTVDQPEDHMMRNGGLPGLHRTASFGSRSAERLATLRRHQPTGPLMCAEFWNGWFDHWGGTHHRQDAAEAASELDELLSAGASVNLYMFHGGTNFGFTNGANDRGVYEPTVTSYDYDAPLDESGHTTPKYWAFREVLSRHGGVPGEVPQAARPAGDAILVFDRVLPLAEAGPAFGAWTHHQDVIPMDRLGRFNGFVVYRTRIDTESAAVLSVREVRDRAQVFLDGSPLGVLERASGANELLLPGPAHGTLELLVEDQGRVNYGPRIGEHKGLIGPIRLGGAALLGWHTAPLLLEDSAAISHALAQRPAQQVDEPLSGPCFASVFFDVEDPPDPARGHGDLHLETSGLTKGVAWVNGFCLGRYWSRGPQATLYIPGPILRGTGNELVVFELHGGNRRIWLLGHPDLERGSER